MPVDDTALAVTIGGASGVVNAPTRGEDRALSPALL